MTRRSVRKSTIVRAMLWWPLGPLSHLAPAIAARIAARLWFAIPPRARSGEDVEDGSSFAVPVGGRVVRGTVQGDGPLVYLVHGWAGDRRQFASLAGSLVTAGCRVVAFDGPSHGRSDPGPLGPGRSHAVEFADALGAVAARFGPARAVVAHSMGAMATMVALRLGRLSTDRLVFVAPMPELRSHLDTFAGTLRLGRRARRRLDAYLEARVGMTIEAFRLLSLAEHAAEVPLLVVHDRDDRRLSWAASDQLVAHWPSATLVSTTGLGHGRLLADVAVHEQIARFVMAEPPGILAADGDHRPARAQF